MKTTSDERVIYAVLMFILCIVALCMLSGCKPAPVRGFVVAKEYVPAYMSNLSPRPVSEAAMIPIVHPVVVSRPAPPHRVAATWTAWIANRDGVYQITTDSITYGRLHCGQRWVAFRTGF